MKSIICVIATSFVLFTMIGLGEEDVFIPEFTALRTQYEKLIKERVSNPADAAQKLLDARYAKAVKTELEREKAAGRLESVVTLQDEQKRLEEGGELPEDDPELLPILIRLRSTYKIEITRIEAERAKSLKVIQAPYVTRLKALEVELTISDRLKHAITVKEYRASLTTGKPLEEEPASGNVESANLFESVDGMVRTIPREILRDLRKTSSQIEAVDEGNKYLREKVLNKWIKVTTTPIKVESVSNGLRKFRFHFPSNELGKNDGNIVGGYFWAIFSPDSTDDPAEVTTKKEVTFKGRIDRCELVRSGGIIKIHIDIMESELIKSK